MILNIITLVACLMILIIFRIADKSNPKIAKLRRYSSKIFNDFKSLTESERRKINDSTIEMDILIKKSNSLLNRLNNSIVEIDERFNNLDIEKSNLQKVEEDIRVISNAARDVNVQIDFIASAKENFQGMAKKISKIEHNIESMKSEKTKIVQDFYNSLDEKSQEYDEKIYDQINRVEETMLNKENELIDKAEEKIAKLSDDFSESLERTTHNLKISEDNILSEFSMKVNTISKTIEGVDNLNNRLDGMKINLSNLESSVFLDIKEKTNEIKNDISESIDNYSQKKSEINDMRDSIIEELRTEGNNTLHDIKNKTSDMRNEIKQFSNEVYDKVNQEVDSINEKLVNVESNIDNSKEKLIKSFEKEVEKVRKELDNLNIHAVTKREEIIQAARDEAEAVKRKIEDFVGEYAKLESRLLNTADEKLESINNGYQTIELRFDSMLERFAAKEEHLEESAKKQIDSAMNEFFNIERRLTEIKEEVLSYESSNRIFERTDEMMKKADDSLNYYNNMLKQSQDETRKLENLLSNFDMIKEMRKEIEKEIRVYQAKKGKLFEVETEIKGLLELNDIIINKTESVQENINKVDHVQARVDILSESYSSLESSIAELMEYENVISKNLESVNKSDLIIQTIDGKVNSFQKIIKRSEKRVDKINNHIKDIEENTLILKSRDSEIQDLKDKFNEIDGISEYMEKRIDQIHAMFQKVETVRKAIDESDVRLQEMLVTTDNKMREFADFIQVVDNNNPIIKQIRKDIPVKKNINESVVKTVRGLSNKGFSADEISKKMSIDENSVRLILNTTSL